MAWFAACWAAAAVVCIHATRGAAALAIAAADRPRHSSSVSVEITDREASAFEFNSAERLFHAAAPAIIGPAPGPVYMRVELISGGNAPKSKVISLVLFFADWLRRYRCGIRRSAWVSWGA